MRGRYPARGPFLLFPCLVFSTLLFLCLGAPAARADSLDVVKGDAAWHPWETPTTGGTAYWNNWSIDSNHQCNVGFWLSGTGGCAANGGAFMADSPGVTAPYLGGSDTGFGLTKAVATESVTVTLKLHVSSYRTDQEFGWYDQSAPTTLNALFVGVGVPNSSATFIPSAKYGFYMRSPEGTYTSLGVGADRTHFAVFQLPGNEHYVVGTEDMWTASDWDFNDTIWDIQVNTQDTDVPEPGTFILLVTGLAAVGRRAARRHL